MRYLFAAVLAFATALNAGAQIVKSGWTSTADAATARAALGISVTNLSAATYTNNATGLPGEISGLGIGTNRSAFALVTSNSAVRWVSTSGNDSTALAGRRDRPYLTIEAALTAATSGSVVKLEPGYYGTAATITYVSNGISLYGSGMASTFITNGSASSVQFYMKGNNHLSDFTTDLYIGGDGTNNVVTHCKVARVGSRQPIDGIFPAASGAGQWFIGWCEFISSFDCYNDQTFGTSAGEFRFVGCRMKADVSLVTGADNASKMGRAVRVGKSPVYLIGCSVEAYNGTNINAAVVLSATASKVYISGSQLVHSNTGPATSYAVQKDAAGTNGTVYFMGQIPPPRIELNFDATVDGGSMTNLNGANLQPLSLNSNSMDAATWAAAIAQNVSTAAARLSNDLSVSSYITLSNSALSLVLPSAGTWHVRCQLSVTSTITAGAKVAVAASPAVVSSGSIFLINNGTLSTTTYTTTPLTTGQLFLVGSPLAQAGAFLPTFVYDCTVTTTNATTLTAQFCQQAMDSAGSALKAGSWLTALKLSE